jgi:hypothetical protein
MIRVYNNLQEQLKTEEYRKDAEDCIKIYNKLKEIGEGKVWISCWNALTMPILDKSLPVLGYQPNSVGEIFLKGIDYEDTTI